MVANFRVLSVLMKPHEDSVYWKLELRSGFYEGAKVHLITKWGKETASFVKTFEGEDPDARTAEGIISLDWLMNGCICDLETEADWEDCND